MNAAVLGGPFGHRPDTGYGPSFALAFAIHAVLVAVLFLGVRMQSYAPESVQVELWEPPPPAPVVEPPKPEPKVEVKPPPEPPKPEPKIEKPQIVEKALPKPKPEPKPKPVPKAEPKPKPEAKKRDVDLERRMQEQLAQEQAASEERRIRDQLAREAASSRARALNEYVRRIQTKVKSNWILPQDLKGNPEAVFLVSQLPSGDVLSVRILKSSGNPAYDTAVERAILKSSPLPLPASREDFARELKLTFRPQDK